MFSGSFSQPAVSERGIENDTPVPPPANPPAADRGKVSVVPVFLAHAEQKSSTNWRASPFRFSAESYHIVFRFDRSGPGTDGGVGTRSVSGRGIFFDDDVETKEAKDDDGFVANLARRFQL